MAGIRPIEKWIPTPEILERIKELAQKGCTEHSIARCLGIHPGQWYTKKKAFPEIQEILDQGRASGENEVTGYLWNIIRNPEHRQHFAAICFYLKTQHNWRETNREEDKPGLPSSVQFSVKESSNGTS